MFVTVQPVIAKPVRVEAISAISNGDCFATLAMTNYPCLELKFMLKNQADFQSAYVFSPEIYFGAGFKKGGEFARLLFV